MKRLLILSAVCAAAGMYGLSEVHARPIACAAQAPKPLKGHWYYRIIDGRKCWYEGKANIPKSSLHWPGTAQKSSDTSEPPLEASARKPATDGRKAIGSATTWASDQEPEPAGQMSQSEQPSSWPMPFTDDGSFESRWRGLTIRN